MVVTVKTNSKKHSAKRTASTKDDTTKKALEMLEQGVSDVFTSENYRNYLSTMSKFYNYSFGNCLLIKAQCPQASYVAGFNAWKNNFKRFVKKGEKGLLILAPNPYEKKIVEQDEDGEDVETIVKGLRFKATYVFDVSQTDGEPLPTICNSLTGDNDMYEKYIAGIKAISPVPVRFEHINGGAHGYYSHAEKVIAVEERDSQTQQMKTITHELAHSILHNKENGEQASTDRRTKEVQAESVAYVVCNHFGIDTSSYSFEYVATWSAGKETKELKASLDIIQKTAKSIIERMEKALVA